MAIRIWVDQVTFSDSTVLTFGATDVIVVVGPNNSGKSESLHGVRRKLESSKNVSPVIESIRVGRHGSEGELRDWISRVGTPQPSKPGVVTINGNTVIASDAIRRWGDASEGLGGLSRPFLKHITAETRLNAANPPANISLTKEVPKDPIHVLQRDDAVELQISRQFRNAFGIDLVVHRNAGNEVPLYVGERPIPGPGEDRLSIGYIRNIEKLAPLKSQGDGMRSFAGVLLHTNLGDESIVFIDEPEAFLHPPQARLLGRMLASFKATSRQVFVATHSGDVLRGILDSSNPDVRVVRVRREGYVNVARELQPSDVAELWRDPLLRYSNILDGVFHETVILCEGDSDCRFYAAITDALSEAQGEAGTRPDVMFAHCGGKHRLPMVIRSLISLSVPIRAIVDFDVLNNEKPLRDIVEAAGGDWNAIETDWRLVKTSIEAKKPELSTPEVSADIMRVLDATSEAIFPTSARDQIQNILRRSSPWATAKTAGKAFIPNGNPTQAFDRVALYLRSIGVHIVEAGTLECFDRSAGGRSGGWVNEVLKRDLVNDRSLKDAREFMQQVLAEAASPI